MPEFSFHSTGASIAITGYQPWHGLVRYRSGMKKHDGPTIELTITSPHDDPEVFNVPYPLGVQALRKRAAFYGAILFPAEGRALKALIEKFAAYVVKNHGWSHPNRPNCCE